MNTLDQRLFNRQLPLQILAVYFTFCNIRTDFNTVIMSVYLDQLILQAEISLELFVIMLPCIELFLPDAFVRTERSR